MSDRVVAELGSVDILVNSAAQRSAAQLRTSRKSASMRSHSQRQGHVSALPGGRPPHALAGQRQHHQPRLDRRVHRVPQASAYVTSKGAVVQLTGPSPSNGSTAAFASTGSHRAASTRRFPDQLATQSSVDERVHRRADAAPGDAAPQGPDRDRSLPRRRCLATRDRAHDRGRRRLLGGVSSR